MTTGERIKEVRLRKGLTQDDLAALLGYKSRSSINKIEVDGRDIPRSKVVKLAKILDVTPSYLMGWEDMNENFDKDVVAMTIGERIKEQRKKVGISVDELAEILGKNRATIYRYESSDIEKLPTTVLEPLARALKTTPAHLMGWDELWDEEVEKVNNEFEKIHNHRKELVEMVFDDESERALAYDLILELNRLNLDGLKELKKRQDELCRLDEYINLDCYKMETGE